MRLSRLFYSLRLRIFLIVALIGVMSCLAVHFAILESYENRAVSVRTSEVQTQMMIIANHLINYNYLMDPSSEVVNAELDMLANLYDGRVIVIDSGLRIRRDTYGISQGRTIISEEVVRCLKNGVSGATSKYDRQNGYIEMTTPIVATQQLMTGDITGRKQTQEVTRGVLLTSVSTDYIRTTLNVLSRSALTIEIILILFILVFAYWMSLALLRPFTQLTRAIEEVKAGFTSEPIVGPGYVETERIVHAFNQLLQRMKVLDDSRQEFVANVSHELKTPITSVKVLADSLLTQEEVPAEVYRDFMEDIAAEVDREDKIITDLLSLVRMDKRATELNITTVDVGAMTEIVLKRLRPIARKHDISLTLETRRTIMADIDEVKMSMVLTNLVENGIKYNHDGGFVQVVLDADHQYFTIEVSDSGIGIPEESLGHIFERFYRVDKSHSREIGGTGLGLAITRSAVLMHRGTIDVSSVPGEGTTFTVRIPLTHAV
ncbi:MAG: two-component sensor histidine kinase [Butyrivibrio sp.]|nr:two-component sensor histidine kinase [Butyrivibrio sp.]